MASVTVTRVHLTPSAAGVTQVGYEYTLTCDAAECHARTPLALTVSLIRAGEKHDRFLGGSMDPHAVVCDPERPTVSALRVFPVATHVVDEDWGPDDIDLVLWVSDGRTLPTSGRALASGKG